MAQTAKAAAELNVGAGGNQTIQQDAARAEPITTAGGLAFTLAVVADGDDSPLAGRMAAEAVKQFFAAVIGSRQPEVSRLLELGLKAAAEACSAATTGGDSARLSLAASAVIGRRLVWVNAGTTSVFVVTNGRRAERLDAVSDGHLWPGKRPANERFPVQERSLRAGESVVLCSDGLTQPRAAGQPAFVTDVEIAHWVNGHAPLKAARYLLSEALGRNAPDNLAVVVIQAPTSPLAALVSAPVLIGAALVVVVLISITGLLAAFPGLAKPPTPVPTPIPDGGGINILVGEAEDQSGAVVIPKLGGGLLYPGTILTASQPSEFQLVFPDGSSDSAQLFLEKDSVLVLDQLALESGAQVNPTQLTLNQGAMLIVQGDSTRVYRIRTAAGILSASMSSQIFAVEVAVQNAVTTTTAYCLSSACQWTSTTQADKPVALAINRQLVSAASTPTDISQESLARWAELCRCAELGYAPAATATATTPPPTVTPTEAPSSSAPPSASATVTATAVPTDVIGSATVVLNRGIESANLRIAGAPTAGIRDIVFDGTDVAILAGPKTAGDGSSWYEVRLPSGKEGWLSATVLQRIQIIAEGG